VSSGCLRVGSRAEAAGWFTRDTGARKIEELFWRFDFRLPNSISKRLY
jgi:hypothetical protein